MRPLKYKKQLEIVLWGAQIAPEQLKRLHGFIRGVQVDAFRRGCDHLDIEDDNGAARCVKCKSHFAAHPQKVSKWLASPTE